ncbi:MULTISPECIES: hypothetical protein [unclassified Amycolatopsis]|uniref:hypothetical protein n=1 Tax=unclassified Amycolatopsis TaxID=2618356 RepID=UPI002876280A|nr:MULTISPECIES: hypothetical protein [unclassified Amycolatopsis]MDS0136747.1 hypothetical protein [Amycolatopsis sp. 505]MDS0143412.1 hypothetical protein [Amycolatopsis sp. CM201R]
MRGDWIHDWVQVEMAYRAGERPAPVVRERPAAHPWKTLWAALFPPRRAAVRHP